MYYLAHPPPLVGGHSITPGVFNAPIPYGSQNEYGYHLNAGCGVTSQRYGLVGAAITSQAAQLAYFRAPSTFIANTIRFSLTVNAGATPTVSQFGIYTVDPTTGALPIQLGATANDTSLFTSGASNSATKTVALTAGVPIVQNTWYCALMLCVTAASVPTLGFTSSGPGAVSNIALASLPRLNGTVAGQTSLPASISAGSVVAGNVTIWMELLP